MRVPISWLREYVRIPADQTGRAIADRLVRAGLEVETVQTVGAEVTGPLVVGQVLSIEELSGFKKPIRYCRVRVGAGNGEIVDGATTDERSIICGATNFRTGDLVVVALPGAVLPGGFEIASRHTYGRLSDGMITSERELGMGDDHAGIIVLPVGSGDPGDSGYAVLGLGDEVLDIAVTPDRGYALSVRGVAREAATAYALPFADPALVDPADLLAAVTAESRRAGEQYQTSGEGPAHECQILDPTGADRFVLRSLSGLDPAAASPIWMRRRLIACGMRPISLAVDVTNYVMLELGQPLHAFDRAKLSGPLQVRRASAGQTLETLDHVVRDLTVEDLLIADGDRPLALAGTMGGLDSEIDGSTREVVLEAVHFDAVTVARMSRRHKLSSEASRRFERGVDPHLPAVASARAAQLLCELGGASYIGFNEVDIRATPESVRMAADLPARVSGVAIGVPQVIGLLADVGCEVELQGNYLSVRPPTWRPDLTDPADLVEEVVRLWGYQDLPATLPRARAGFGLTPAQRMRRRVGRVLAGMGLTEITCYPFIGGIELDSLDIEPGDARRGLVTLANPLSEESPHLRTTLLPGLVSAARRNLGRGTSDLAIYEVGLVFRGAHVGRRTDPPRPSVLGRPAPAELAGLLDLLPTQPRHLGALLAGAAERPGWWGAGRAYSWADAVAVVRDLASEMGVELTISASPAAPWHPGRCAAFSLGSMVIGHAGELHPRVVSASSLPERTCAIELDLDAMMAASRAVAPAPAVGTFPVAKEDLALVVADSVTSQALGDAVREGAGELVESVRLFDVYTGPQVGSGRKSLAFSLRLRAPDRTLSAAEVATAREGAIRAAGQRCGATLRE